VCSSDLQRFINAFGNDAIAAYGAAANVDNLFFLPAISLNLAVSAMAGQNVGAGKLDRARMTAATALIYSGVVSLALGLLCIAVPSWLLSPFLQAADTGALAIGERLLRILGLPYLFITSMVVLNGFFNGVGDTLASMFLSIVSLWVLRVPLVWRLSDRWGLDGVWAGIAVGYVLSLFLALGYYALGTWKRNLRRE
jgi:Na+-driven multidrug efflux pump